MCSSDRGRRLFDYKWGVSGEYSVEVLGLVKRVEMHLVRCKLCGGYYLSISWRDRCEICGEDYREMWEYPVLLVDFDKVEGYLVIWEERVED